MIIFVEKTFAQTALREEYLKKDQRTMREKEMSSWSQKFVPGILQRMAKDERGCFLLHASRFDPQCFVSFLLSFGVPFDGQLHEKL